MLANQEERNAKLTEGFSVLLKRCLQVRHDDSILLLFDESFLPFLGLLVPFLISERLQATFLMLPKSYQKALIGWSSAEDYEIGLPPGVVSACREATIIMSCLDGDLATARIRGAILHNFRPNECRFAHIPGLSEDILETLTVSPVEQILQWSETLAWAIGEAVSAELLTWDGEGKECRLQMEMDGWDNEPMMSSGVIYPNSWGNAVPGEVFCCPNHVKVNGTVCINGSVPDIELHPGDETTIEFKDGHLTSWWPENTPVARFLSEQRSLAMERHDANWNAFAELGIGLNPAITKLTGNSLFDEKALGTIHVAIGNNKSFGHKIKSYIHADMVVTGPTLSFDGTTIVDRGRVRFDTIESLRAEAKAAPLCLSPDAKLSFRLAKLDFRRSRPMRRLISAGRLGYVPIEELSNDLWLEDAIQIIREEVPVTYTALKQSWAEYKRLDHALSILHHYGVLTQENYHENSHSNHSVSARRSRLQRH